MLLQHYGIVASEGEMAYLANSSLLGTDAWSMVRALSRKAAPYGLRARHRHPESLVDLGDRPAPFVAHIFWRTGYGHAVFVEHIAAEGVVIIDPLDGQRSELSLEQFERAWDGTAIYLMAE